MGGRVGAVYGHKNVAAIGGMFWVIFHLISGFMRSVVSLSVTRALSGVGAAFIFPNAVALLTITYPPGKARNISVGLFGAMAPVGAAGGSVFPGLFGQLSPWWWLFFFLYVLHHFLKQPEAFRPLTVPSQSHPRNCGFWAFCHYCA
jgi:MFS family permease